MSYNPVDSETLFSFLDEMGFEPIPTKGEVVYARTHHKLPSLSVRVYTSCRKGSSVVKGCGKDAIRVALVYTHDTGKTFGVEKNKRVYRTGKTEDILNRIRERARSAYAKANAMAKKNSCGCGAPRWESGNCSAFCWKKEG